MAHSLGNNDLGDGDAVEGKLAGTRWWDLGTSMCGDIVHTGDEAPSVVAVAGVLIGELAGPFSRMDGSAGRIRTYDQPVNSRLLYH
jgi:hypothetical protein